MLYVTRYTMRRMSRAQFFLRASLSDAWSAVTAKPNSDDPFIDPKVQERVGKLISRAGSVPKLIAQPVDERPIFHRYSRATQLTRGLAPHLPQSSLDENDVFWYQLHVEKRRPCVCSKGRYVRRSCAPGTRRPPQDNACL
jgi:hypothetical protein